MITKTDNAAEVGVHKFEKAGLGKAPFRYVGLEQKIFQACQGAPIKPGGTCDYCGTSILYCFHLLSADGKASAVGSDCIMKAGDAGILRAYKSSPEFRKIQREKRQAKSRGVMAALKALKSSEDARLRSLPHPDGFTDRKTGQPLTWADYFTWHLDHCGASGREALLRRVKLELGIALSRCGLS